VQRNKPIASITASSGDVIQCALAILEIGDLFVDIAGLQDLGAVEPTFRFQVPHVYSKHLQSPKIDAAWLRKHHKSRTLSNYGPIFLDPHADLPGETPCCLTKHLLPQILRIYKV